MNSLYNERMILGSAIFTLDKLGEQDTSPEEALVIVCMAKDAMINPIYLKIVEPTAAGQLLSDVRQRSDEREAMATLIVCESVLRQTLAIRNAPPSQTPPQVV